MPPLTEERRRELTKLVARRGEEARVRLSRAKAYWGRGAAVLERLATCLEDDGDLYHSFLTQPAVEAVRRNANRSADAEPPKSLAPGRVGRRPGSSRRRQRLP